MDVAAVYASDDFIHVPEWMPRPEQAVAVSAADATLRSDGLREGTVSYTLKLGLADAADWLGNSLAAAGLQAEAGQASYVSESPPRRCDVEKQPLSPELTRITLRYQATDHGSGCHCPTCHPLETTPE